MASKTQDETYVMARSEADLITSKLRTIRKQVENVQNRFADYPLNALLVSAEAPPPGWGQGRFQSAEVARYLMVPAENVIASLETETAHPSDAWPHRPYYAYIPPGTSLQGEEVSRLIDRQVSALRPLFDALDSLLETLPKWIRERYCFPATPYSREWRTSWWKILFHLAAHYPDAFLEVTRRRWVNTFEYGSVLAGGEPAIPVPRGTDKVRENSWQLDNEHPPSADIWPGMIWCELKYDIFGSTKSAIEVMIRLVVQADTRDQGWNAEAFAGILAEFEELAEPGELPAAAVPPVDIVADMAAREESAASTDHDISEASSDGYWEESRRCCQPVLLRFGSPFSTPPVREWCESLSPLDDCFDLVARWQGFVEYVTHRNMHSKFDTLCAKAGALLPLFDGVVPLKSPIRKFDWRGLGMEYSDCAVLTADPKLRWIRFVFDTLRDFRPDELIAQFPNATRQLQFAEWAPDSCTQLKNCFFQSSATVIRLMTVGQTAPHIPQSTANKPKGGKRTRRSESNAFQTPAGRKVLELQHFTESTQGKAYKHYVRAEKALKMTGMEIITDWEAYKWLRASCEKVAELKFSSFTAYMSRARRFYGVLKNHPRQKGKSGSKQKSKMPEAE